MSHHKKALNSKQCEGHAHSSSSCSTTTTITTTTSSSSSTTSSLHNNLNHQTCNHTKTIDTSATTTFHQFPGSSIYFDNQQNPMNRLPSFKSLLFNLNMDTHGLPSDIPCLNNTKMNEIIPYDTCEHLSRTDTIYSNKDFESSSPSTPFECNNNRSSSTSKTIMLPTRQEYYAQHTCSAMQSPPTPSSQNMHMYASPILEIDVKPNQESPNSNNRNACQNSDPSGKSIVTSNKHSSSNMYTPYPEIVKKNIPSSTTSSSDSSSREPSPSKSSNKKTSRSKSSGVWSEEEHNLFLQGLESVGENWKLISDLFVKTRSRRQVASHAQKFLGRKL